MFEEGGCDHKHEEEAEPQLDSLKKCPLCDVDLQRTDQLHPIMVGLGNGDSLLVFFHERCYRSAQPERVEAAVRDAKYDIMLATADENSISTC